MKTPPAPGLLPMRSACPCASLHLLWALLLLLAIGCDSPRPNLLIIAVDTLRADHLGAYGYRRGTSPATDALFDSSIVFDDVQASSAWTLPSFASLMTSLHTATHGCRSFSSRLPGSYTTLAELLRDAGYTTAAIVSHHFLDARYGLAQGFDHYDQSLVLGLDDSHRAVSSPAIHERADAWLRSERGADPWFLWVHYFDPHHDYQVHPGVTEKFGTELIDRYDGEIAFTDTHVRKLLATLRDIGEDEETIVVFVSDHGEEFGDHGLQGHGRALHREVTRLALAVRVPGWPHAGVDEPVHAVDLLPTLLELLDVPLPKSPLAGRSLIPLMRGGRGARLEPRGLLAEVSLYAGSVHSTYRLGRFKLFEHREPGGTPARSLFDIEADPNETIDLADRYPRVVEEYARALREERRAALALRKQLGEPERVDLNEDDLTRLRALGYVE